MLLANVSAAWDKFPFSPSFVERHDQAKHLNKGENLRYVNNATAWSKANISGGQKRFELYTFLCAYLTDKSIYLVDSFSLNKKKNKMYCTFVTVGLHNSRKWF